jgi:predicted metal-dependent enzyme (double-stranded beta helix superfamily)
MAGRPLLLDLLHRWDASPGAIGYTELRAGMRELELGAADLAAWITFDDRTYCRVAIHRRPHYEVLVLCWKSGQISAIHDHAGSSCVVRVIAGHATETRYARSPCGRLMPRHSRQHGPGRVLGCRGDGIHQMANLQPAGQHLVTLLVYSPPPSRWHFYSLENTTLAGHDRLIQRGPRTIVAEAGQAMPGKKRIQATRRVAR